MKQIKLNSILAYITHFWEEDYIMMSMELTQ